MAKGEGQGVQEVKDWTTCLETLALDLSQEQYNTWIRPLQADQSPDGALTLYAPNKFIKDQVAKEFLTKIRHHFEGLTGNTVQIRVGAAPSVRGVMPGNDRSEGSSCE